jgi:FAD-dependent oxidoreductase domain-containing protein 1
LTLEENMTGQTYDVVIVGGGMMGCSVAYHLMKADGTIRVSVVEKDPGYEKASTTLSMANVRTQFSLKENVLISKYAMDVLERFGADMAVDGEAPDIAFRREGNLFLCDEDGRGAAFTAMDTQKELGCSVEWWSPADIRGHYPFYRTDEYIGATFGAKDGHLDAYAVLMGYKAKARQLGAVFITDAVIEVLTRGKAVRGVRLASGNELISNYVVNCAGAWAAQVAETCGVKLPVQPVGRHVFALDTKVKPDGPLPLTILPSGLYFRTELGGLILLGKSLAEDNVGFDPVWDRDRFQELLWPELALFVPAFDTLKLVRGWAGLYAVNTLDGNAILGPWPELEGLFLANGFSGHGLQQGPAVGRYLSELILQRPVSLDLSIFSPERIVLNRPLSENGLV